VLLPVSRQRKRTPKDPGGQSSKIVIHVELLATMSAEQFAEAVMNPKHTAMSTGVGGVAYTNEMVSTELKTGDVDPMKVIATGLMAVVVLFKYTA
jgi:hypothetical protein